MTRSVATRSFWLVWLLIVSQAAVTWGQAALAAFPTPAAAPAVSFPDLNAAQAAIVDDPEYFDQLQPMEMSAKTGAKITGATLQEQRAACRRRYQAGVRQFTEQEKDALRGLIARIEPAVRTNYPLYAATPWSFLKLSDNIEGGLPHTRGKHIVFSESMCRQFAAAAAARRAGSSPPLNLIDLLLHEQTHVLQRAHPDLFDSLYTKVWGFEKAQKITDNPWLVEHHLANPDALDCRWLFPLRQPDGSTRHLWPLVVLSDGPGPKQMPNDFLTLAIYVHGGNGQFTVDSQANGRAASDDLLDVEAYRKTFPLTTNIYHPHEAAASVFARLVVWDEFVPKARIGAAQRDAVEKSLGPLRTWCRANLVLPAQWK